MAIGISGIGIDTIGAETIEEQANYVPFGHNLGGVHIEYAAEMEKRKKRKEKMEAEKLAKTNDAQE